MERFEDNFHTEMKLSCVKVEKWECKYLT